jgi:hypothetical protein
MVSPLRREKAAARKLSLLPDNVALTLWFCPTEEQTARELRELSPCERELVWADLRGNERLSNYRPPSSCDPEEEKVEEELLQELQKAMQAIISKDKDKRKVFEQTVFRAVSPRYVDILQRNFVLMHCCESRKQESEQILAQRVVQHLNELYRLFGGSLDPDEMLPVDPSPGDLELSKRAGRRVLFTHLDGLFTPKGTNSVVSNVMVAAVCLSLRPFYLTCCFFTFDFAKCRSFWYNLAKASKNATIRRLGMVKVFYLGCQYQRGALDYEMILIFWNLVRAMPIRLGAVYFVFHDSSWKSVVDTCIQLSPPAVRLRTRSIQGK